jgi:ribosomal protein L7Ae-like RNA K-turn-binding protein
VTERLLERAALDSLSMAHKGHRLVAGFSKVEKALLRDRLGALLHASDAAPDGVRKLDSALQRRDDADEIPVISSFSGEQLNLALGRPNVVHAALLASPESDGFLARFKRLHRFRTGGATADLHNKGLRNNDLHEKNAN